MNDPFDASCFGRVDKLVGVLHGERLSVPSVVEAHPISIDKNIRALERFRKSLLTAEIEGKGFDSAVERIGAIGMAGESDDFFTALQQPFGDVLARIRKCAGDRDLHFDSALTGLGATSAKNETIRPMPTSAVR